MTPSGTIFTYQLNGETVSALRKFSENRITDSIARSLKARIGHDVTVSFSSPAEGCDLYEAKWFDGDSYQQATIAVAEVSQ